MPAHWDIDAPNSPTLPKTKTGLMVTTHLHTTLDVPSRSCGNPSSQGKTAAYSWSCSKVISRRVPHGNFTTCPSPQKKSARRLRRRSPVRQWFRVWGLGLRFQNKASWNGYLFGVCMRQPNNLNTDSVQPFACAMPSFGAKGGRKTVFECVGVGAQVINILEPYV